MKLEPYLELETNLVDASPRCDLSMALVSMRLVLLAARVDRARSTFPPKLHQLMSTNMLR